MLQLHCVNGFFCLPVLEDKSLHQGFIFQARTNATIKRTGMCWGDNRNSIFLFSLRLCVSADMGEHCTSVLAISLSMTVSYTFDRDYYSVFAEN